MASRDIPLTNDATLNPQFRPDRRRLLRSAAAIAAGVAAGQSVQAVAAPAMPSAVSLPPATGALGNRKIVGYMLAHEQFPVTQLAEIGETAAKAGFGLLATSDHLQPWQANERHSGEAWVTLGAVGGRLSPAWMGTTVTCPILRYQPAVVAEAFATLAQFYPGRVFLGVGSGEALNEQAATGQWPKWQERWDRLVEAIGIIRALWAGDRVSHHGTYYTVDAQMTDSPPKPIPLLTAANGKKSMRLAGQYGDGLVTDPLTWQKFKSEWQDGARQAGKDPDQMPVLVEQYVVVGDQNEAAKAAELWRFGPKAFKQYFNIPDPSAIEQRADAEVPIEKVLDAWAVGADPAIHIAKLRELFDSGVTIVNVHSGQPDQRKVIDFYGRSVLPQFAT